MNTLFDIAPVLPKGFTYHPDFISVEEENKLIDLISNYDLKNMQFHEYEAKRKVISFGKGWSFTEQQLKQGIPIPGDFDFLVVRIATHLMIRKELIAQFLVTEYPVGSVINWHRDAPPFETIAGISLLANCRFKLRPHEKTLQTKANTISLSVARRSLYIMTDESKMNWQHCTAPLSKVRYSLTFRTLKQ